MQLQHLAMQKRINSEMLIINNKSKILNCRLLTLEKKGQLFRGFFGIFEIVEHPFSDHIQKSMCS